MIRRFALLLMAFTLACSHSQALADDGVRIKDLGRFLGWQQQALVGYGIVTGLTGTGDSPRNPVTQRALTNVVGRLGSSISPDQAQSRNVAAVMVTAVLPGSANAGDQMDVTVTSIGDARSLAGGVLLMTQLLGPDQRPYALAQGPLVVGGYQFASNQNSEQRNFPTAGIVSNGATIGVSTTAEILQPDNQLIFVIRDADFTTATRIADAINQTIGASRARVTDASRVSIDTGGVVDLYRLVAAVENIVVRPAASARVVVNERSGTVVAGGDVSISSVVVSQGDIRVSIRTRNEASQPLFYDGYGENVRSLVVANTEIELQDDESAVISFPNTTVADLIQGLNRARVSTRDQIAILQSIKAAGALHADLIVQ